MRAQHFYERLCGSGRYGLFNPDLKWLRDYDSLEALLADYPEARPYPDFGDSL